MELALNIIYYLLFITMFYVMGKHIEKKEYAKACLSFAIGLGLFISWIGPIEINIHNQNDIINHHYSNK